MTNGKPRNGYVRTRHRTPAEGRARLPREIRPAMTPSFRKAREAAVGDGSQGVTIARALAGPHTLRVGVVWWSFGILMATT
jgi:hypothetical protein